MLGGDQILPNIFPIESFLVCSTQLLPAISDICTLMSGSLHFSLFVFLPKWRKNEKISYTVFAWKWQLIVVTLPPKLTKNKRWHDPDNEVLQTIQIKLILLCDWAEPAILDSTLKLLQISNMKFKYANTHAIQCMDRV